MSVLNWQLRRVLPELRDEGRLNFLIALLTHVNIRMRAHPGMDLLCKEMAFELQAVTAAKKWHIARGSIVLVPNCLRVEDERKLPPRQHVYQLTGIIKMASGEVAEYLYMSPEARADIERSVNAINVLAVKTFGGQNIRQSKVLTIKTEGSSSSLSGSLSLSSGSGSESREDEEARPNIYTLYEQNIGLLTPIIADQLRAAEQDYPAAWLPEAVTIAVNANKRRWDYVAGILNRWATEGKDSPRSAASGKPAPALPASATPQPLSPFRITADSDKGDPS